MKKTKKIRIPETICRVTRRGKSLKEEAAPKNAEGSARHAYILITGYL
jgi:hypothetical protein